MDEVGILCSVNVSGRFSGKEMKSYGQKVMKRILCEKSVMLCFGQQASFKLYQPEDYVYLGNTKAFLLYHRSQIVAGDDRHYKCYLRDLELQNLLPRYYLPESNYVICKMKTKLDPVEFIAMSWLTDECLGKHKSISQFKNICGFIGFLKQIEQLPIIVSGSFHVDADIAKGLIPPNFRVCSYLPSTKRRSVRQSNFFICSQALTFSDVKPVVCGKMKMEDGNKKINTKLINPEDVFYWDPCMALLKRKPDLIKQTINILDVYIKQQEENKRKPTSSVKNDFMQTTASNYDYTVNKRQSQLRTVASFEELYDEEIIENTTKTGISKLSCEDLPIIHKMEEVNDLFKSLVNELNHQFEGVKSHPRKMLDNKSMSSQHAMVLDMIASSTKK